MKLSRVFVIVAVTAAIVYAGLTYLLPRGGNSTKTDTAAAAGFASESTATADAAAAPAATDEAPAEAAVAATEAAPADDAAAAGEDPSLTEEEARRIAENVASEVATRVAGESPAPAADAAAEPVADVPAEAPVEPAAEPAVESASADAGNSGLTDEQARRIAENVAREVAAQSGATVEEPAAAAPTVATAPEPAPAPAPATRSEVAASKPASSAPSAPKPVRKVKPNAPPSGKVGNGADVITAWWSKSSSTDRLNLVYAGEASSEKAVVLMFDGAVDAAAAGSQIKLIDATGGTPSGSWSSGGNPRLIAFKGVKPGRYTVIVAPGMADTGGKSVGTELVGPVYVH